MVIKIYPPAPSAASALEYNERKIAEGKASVISSNKIDDPRDPMATFLRYENGSRRCEKMSFHASVNPSVTDKFPPERIPDFVREYMQKMGYGNQPYVLYRHTDTGRDHYHIVSVRVDENGKKIPDFQEKKRSQKAMKELMEKYGFEIGKAKKEAAQKEFNPYDGFKPEAGDYGRQIEAIAALALQYHFRKPEHFDLVMESLNVKVVHKKDGGIGFIGLDSKTGKAVTSVIEDDGIRYPSEDVIAKRAEECKRRIHTREKERTANITRTALKKCKTEQHFRRFMAKSSIYTRLSRNVNGNVFGVTFVDHKTKSVFKASELGLKAADFQHLEYKLPPHGKAAAKAGDEKEKETPSEETAAKIGGDIAGLAIAAVAVERNRHWEDEELMRKGKRR